MTEPRAEGLRAAARDIAEGRFIVIDGETGDEWCFFCDAPSGHKTWCSYTALRAALAATPPAEGLPQHSSECAAQDEDADCICGVSDAYALGLRDGAATGLDRARRHGALHAIEATMTLPLTDVEMLRQITVIVQAALAPEQPE